jgi:cell division protease FtsH
MVTRWGMGSLGLAAFQVDEQQPFLGYELAQGRDYSESTAARVDQDVQQLLEDGHQVASQLLTERRVALDRLAETLLHEETVDQDELAQILGPRPEGAIEAMADAEPTRSAQMN